MSIAKETAEAIALSLAEGAGVVIRDAQGCAEPILGRIVQITFERVLVDVGGDRVIQFDRATGFALQPGDGDRWQLSAPGDPAGEEYGDLLIRQGALQEQRERIRADLALIEAVLATADRMAGR